MALTKVDGNQIKTPIGVGTQSPSTTIHLVDSVPTIRFEDTEQGPTVYGSVGGNGGNVILKADEGNASGATKIAFEIDGSEKVRIDSSGNVGIGTDNPAVHLDVYGEPPRIRLVRNSTGVRHELRGNADNLSIRADSSNIGADTIIDFQIDGSEKARIDSNGKVAIGTDSTTHELELYKQQNTGTVLEIQNPSTGAGAHARVGLDADVASLNFYSHGSGRNLERYGTILNEWTEISNTAGNGIVIGTQSQVPIYFGTNDNLRVVINGTNGYLGIGTTNADSPVHLENSGPAITFIDTDDATKSRLRYNTPNLILEADINNGVSASRISFRIDDAAASAEVFGVDSAGVYFNGGTDAFQHYEEGTWTPEVADATSGGNTGTGTLSGYYVRIGDMVHISCNITNVNTTGMTGGNNLSIRGLPFDIVSQTGTIRQTGVVDATGVTYTGSYLVAVAQDNTSYIRIFVQNNSGGSSSIMDVNALNSGTTDLRFSMWYQT